MGLPMPVPVAAADEVRVRIDSDRAIVEARRRGRELADHAGFKSVDLAIIATAISELARNCLLYASRGEIIVRVTDDGHRPGVVIVASDHGPGIADVSQAMQDGYSTSGGLGLGLPGVRRLMDEFEITTGVGQGSKVTAKKWKD